MAHQHSGQGLPRGQLLHMGRAAPTPRGGPGAGSRCPGMWALVLTAWVTRPLFISLYLVLEASKKGNLQYLLLNLSFDLLLGTSSSGKGLQLEIIATLGVELFYP